MSGLSVTCRVWVMIILVLGKGWWGFGCLEKERIALLQLKANINNYSINGISLPSWVEHDEGTTAADCCGWEGVVCSSNTKRVVRLSVGGATLGNWYFNASLFLPFEELRTLNLSDKSMSGWVENEGFERLSRLSVLQVLDLSYNSFDNTVLSSLRGLSSLKYLYLQQNQLQGPTLFNIRLDDFISLKELDLTGNGMEEIFGPVQGFNGSSLLSNLEVLKLSANNFNNNILPSVSGLSNLKFLDLSYNQLKGQIHVKEFHALSNLEKLDLSHNDIENLVNPEGIKSLSKVKVLHLTDIRGPITTEGVRNLSNLEDLFLDYSSHSKDFLQSIGAMTSLKVLSLAHSSINGTLPDQGWCELKNLVELDLSGNQFEGNLPQCLGNLTSLRVFDFASNQITGNIASSPLSALTSLEYLSFSDNLIEVPSSFWSIANYSHLKVLLCSNNRLTVEPMLNTWSPKFQLNIFAFSNWMLDNLNIATPNFLHNQYDLRVVDLSHNKLNGTFPNWLLENNTRLEELYLNYNSFEGSFKLPSRPNPSIRIIDINKNQIGGHIPANVSSIFPKLEILSMSRNAFEGSLTSCFNDMNFLWALDLSNNNLSGEMPEHFALSCPSLQVLKLSNNELGGQLSPSALNLSQLLYLYMDGNKFVGNIPDSLSTLSLLALDVSSNEFSGELPRWIGNMTDIAEIEMFKNHFQGPIPEELCKLNIITVLDLSNNNLYGSLPSCSNPLKVRHLHLYRNKLEGPMRNGFYNSSYLVTLDLRENHFSGSIPTWFGNVSGLSILILKANYFKGEIPIQLCHKSKMSIMDLSQNLLHGPIPRCLGNITTEARNNIRFTYPNAYSSSYPVRPFVESYMFLSVWVHELSFSDLRENVEFATKNNSYAYKGSILNYMSGIDLSCNQLTGEIPSGLGNLSKIKALNLSHNHLTGSIPTAFSNLRQIESLDLSYNNLSGEIPSELTKLSFLEAFSVAFNNLSGVIPSRTGQLGTFEESSYAGNPFLCGLPLHNNCSNDTGLPEHEVEDTGFVDMGVFYGSFAASYIIVLLGIIAVLYINPHWRQAWFYVIEVCITTSYYFVVDNFPKLFMF